VIDVKFVKLVVIVFSSCYCTQIYLNVNELSHSVQAVILIIDLE